MPFKALHHQNTPLLIANVWDVPSVHVAEELGFQAVGTSSAAIAALLGYHDGEEISFKELATQVQRIATSTTLPLSVDIESGYSTEPKAIAAHIKILADMGVVGVNIEDSQVNGERNLQEAALFAEIISQVKTELDRQQLDIFLNVRIDPFLLSLPNAQDETCYRAKLYEQAGADGLFVPCIEQEDDIKAVVASTRLPVNVMCMPGLPDFQKLTQLGVKRISMGNFLYDRMYQSYKQDLGKVVESQSFASVF